ncbi:MAG: PTS sugar transporter subunit IIA [Planctomycetia bacterium]|nr:PTS sugar transporter subunit IIA [Planctomycetia bacterium]
MQRVFTLEELTERLGRTARSIQHAVQDGKLNGHKVRDVWTFNWHDVLLWLESEMSDVDSLEPEQFEKVATYSEPPEQEISFADLINLEAITVSLAAKTQPSVIREMVKLASNTGLLWDPEELEEELRQREAMASTALEDGVAILHPRRPPANIIGDAFLAVALAPHGVYFGAREQTRVFFLLCCPDDVTYLRSLSRLARVLKTPEVIDSLLKCESAVEIKELLLSLEESSN